MEDKNNNIDWRRHTGMTSSLNTGPSADHTTSQGYYMYIETSLAIRKGDNARIWSMTTSSTKGQCISFWYNMYGVSIGTLNVYIADNSTGTEKMKLVWSLSGNQDNTWHIANVPLSDLQSMKLMDACPCPGSIHTLGPSTIAPLSTESQTNSTTRPSITLTITLQTSEAVSTLPTTTVTLPPVSTSPTIVESPINCAFENTSICQYQQGSGEDHDWLRHSGRNKFFKYRTNCGSYLQYFRRPLYVPRII
ncbi:Hypothetical predicted protein [Mytilus galloprovincialis]|uniref:MAM domain-containing protein n=1 Tax=Mytilus galloprovincialis TaxID=29158 RepID=A0A8B6CX53_MYTGA|nr:Hypothetical predicted protein [Mytilus galloprovincialis]